MASRVFGKTGWHVSPVGLGWCRVWMPRLGWLAAAATVVVAAFVARFDRYAFLVPTVGLSVIAKAGTPIAQDGERIWRTPYDEAVLVMPGTRNLKPGGTAVRLGRFATA